MQKQIRGIRKYNLSSAYIRHLKKMFRKILDDVIIKLLYALSDEGSGEHVHNIGAHVDLMGRS